MAVYITFLQYVGGKQRCDFVNYCTATYLNSGNLRRIAYTASTGFRTVMGEWAGQRGGSEQQQRGVKANKLSNSVALASKVVAAEA